MSRITLLEMIEPKEDEVELPDETLSEDEQSAQSELTEAIQETEILDQNNERSIDTVEAMESLRETLSAKGELTGIDLSMMRIATEMAVAGTGYTVRNVMPALESNDPAIALEGFGDRIKEIVSRIGDTIVRILKSIKNVMSKFLLSFRTHINRVRRLLKKAKAIQSSGYSTAEKLSIKDRDVFKQHGKKITDIKQFNKAYGETIRVFDNAIESIFKNARVVNREYGVLSTIKDLLKIRETGERFYGYVDDLTDKLIKDLKLKKAGRINEADVYTSQTTAKEANVEIRVPSAGLFDKKEYGDMKRSIYIYDFRIAEFENKKHHIHGDYEAGPIELDKVDIKDVIGVLETTLDLLLDQSKYISSYIEIADSATVQAEQAILSSLALVTSLAQGLAVAHAPMAAPVIAAVGAALNPVTLNMALREVLFSYKAMSKNNSLTFHALNNCFWFLSRTTSDATWACADMINKGRWK